LLAVTANTMTANDPAAALISRVLGFFALVMVSVNIFGGFLVTQRMLAMYKKKEK
jgi:NAD(P) transhydrogenase subunit alpha